MDITSDLLVGRTIKVFRVAMDMKSKDLAEKIGIKPSYMSSIESGKHTPSKEYVYAILKVLGISKRRFMLEVLKLTWENEQEQPFSEDAQKLLGALIQEVS